MTPVTSPHLPNSAPGLVYEFPRWPPMITQTPFGFRLCPTASDPNSDMWVCMLPCCLQPLSGSHCFGDQTPVTRLMLFSWCGHSLFSTCQSWEGTTLRSLARAVPWLECHPRTPTPSPNHRWTSVQVSLLREEIPDPVFVFLHLQVGSPVTASCKNVLLAPQALILFVPIYSVM